MSIIDSSTASSYNFRSYLLTAHKNAWDTSLEIFKKSQLYLQLNGWLRWIIQTINRLVLLCALCNAQVITNKVSNCWNFLIVNWTFVFLTFYQSDVLHSRYMYLYNYMLTFHLSCVLFQNVLNRLWFFALSNVCIDKSVSTARYLFHRFA